MLGVSACPAAVRPHPPVHHPRGEGIAPLTLIRVCLSRVPADWPSTCRSRVTRTPPPEPPGRQLSGVCRDDRVAADYPHRLRPRRGGAHRRAGHKSASGPRADTVGTGQPGRRPPLRGHVYAVLPTPPARQADRATTVPSWLLCASPRPPYVFGFRRTAARCGGMATAGCLGPALMAGRVGARRRQALRVLLRASRPHEFAGAESGLSRRPGSRT